MKSADTKSDEVDLVFAAFGCADLDTPINMWLRREDHDAILFGCHNGASTYRVVCRDNQWIGNIGDCPESKSMSLSKSGSISVGNISMSVSKIGKCWTESRPISSNSNG